MAEPLRTLNPAAESCPWIRHTVRPIEWARRPRVLAQPQDWRRRSRNPEMADIQADGDDSSLASLLDAVTDVRNGIEAIDALLDQAFVELADTRRRLDAQKEEIAALKRELRRA